MTSAIKLLLTFVPSRILFSLTINLYLAYLFFLDILLHTAFSTSILP